MLWGGLGCMRTSLSDLVYSMLTDVEGSMYMMSRMVLVCPLYFPDRPSDLRIHQEGLSSSPLLTAIPRVTRHGLAKVDSRVEMNGVYDWEMRLFCFKRPAKPAQAVTGLIGLDGLTSYCCLKATVRKTPIEGISMMQSSALSLILEKSPYRK